MAVDAMYAGNLRDRGNAGLICNCEASERIFEADCSVFNVWQEILNKNKKMAMRT